MGYYLVYQRGDEAEYGVHVEADNHEEAGDIAVYQHYIYRDTFLDYIDNRSVNSSFYADFFEPDLDPDNDYHFLVDDDTLFQNVHERIYDFFENDEWSQIAIRHLEDETLQAKDFPPDMLIYIWENDYGDDLLVKSITFLRK